MGGRDPGGPAVIVFECFRMKVAKSLETSSVIRDIHNEIMIKQENEVGEWKGQMHYISAQGGREKHTFHTTTHSAETKR